jgi:hypothetical protein
MIAFCEEHDLEALQATERTASDSWRHVRVMHATLWSESPTGWDVKTWETSL